MVTVLDYYQQQEKFREITMLLVLFLQRKEARETIKLILALGQECCFLELTKKEMAPENHALNYPTS